MDRPTEGRELFSGNTWGGRTAYGIGPGISLLAAFFQGDGRLKRHVGGVNPGAVFMEKVRVSPPGDHAFYQSSGHSLSGPQEGPDHGGGGQGTVFAGQYRGAVEFGHLFGPGPGRRTGRVVRRLLPGVPEAGRGREPMSKPWFGVMLFFLFSG